MIEAGSCAALDAPRGAGPHDVQVAAAVPVVIPGQEGRHTVRRRRGDDHRPLPVPALPSVDLHSYGVAGGVERPQVGPAVAGPIDQGVPRSALRGPDGDVVEHARLVVMLANGRLDPEVAERGPFPQAHGVRGPVTVHVGQQVDRPGRGVAQGGIEDHRRLEAGGRSQRRERGRDLEPRRVERPPPREVHGVLEVPPVAAPAPTGVGPGLHEPFRHVGHQHVVRTVRVGVGVDVDGRPHRVIREVAPPRDGDGVVRRGESRPDGVVPAGGGLTFQVGDHLLQRRHHPLVDVEGERAIGHRQFDRDQLSVDLLNRPSEEAAPGAEHELIRGEVPTVSGVWPADAVWPVAPGRFGERRQGHRPGLLGRQVVGGERTGRRGSRQSDNQQDRSRTAPGQRPVLRAWRAGANACLPSSTVGARPARGSVNHAGAASRRTGPGIGGVQQRRALGRPGDRVLGRGVGDAGGRMCQGSATTV